MAGIGNRKIKQLMSRLIENEDFYYNEDGYMVLTEKFHLAKGFCCGNCCKHCPYNFINVPEYKKNELLKNTLIKKD